MQTLKFSQFCHVVRIPGEDAWAVHSFATGETERLDAVQKALFDVAPTLPVSSPVVRRWWTAGFLVRSDLDEVAHLRKMAEDCAVEYACGNGPYPLTLTVSVTGACNFACPYCFEPTDNTLRMSEDVQRVLVRFVEGRLATGRHDGLEVDWFGGEPLLALETIDFLSRHLIDLARRYGISYRAMVHTNGYLLDQHAVNVLERCSVRNVLVTVDGDRASHDAARHLKDGGPTYDRIVANLRAIRTSMRIIVRCNLHEGNVESFPELKRLMGDIERESGTEIRVSLAAVRPTPTATARGDTTAMLSFEHFARILSDHGMIERKEPFLPTLSPCGITRLSELHIEADGTIYPNCHNAPYLSDLALGNVLDGEPIDWEAAAHKVFNAVGFPDEDPKCLECKLLVCCHGGCHGWRWNNGGAAVCSEYRADPDSYVLGLLG